MSSVDEEFRYEFCQEKTFNNETGECLLPKDRVFPLKRKVFFKRFSFRQ